MIEGVRAVCQRLWLEGRINGVLCLGGAEGALLGAAAMHALPVGVPKLIVSPSASGRRAFGPFVGESDVLVMHSVTDILGLNPIARAVFDNAAAAVAGMARDAGRPVTELGGNSVGITMLGHTTPAVMRIRAALERAGHEPVIFHANGVGGPAMERLIAVGALTGVIDYTLSEVANALLGGLHATGPERLTVAGRYGLPQVVVLGCVDFFNQGARGTLPEEYQGRKTYYHNPVATLVRLEADEMAHLGRIVAERLNESRGPVRVVAPSRGFSLVDVEGGDLWDPDADAAFLEALSSGLRAETPFELVDTHVTTPRSRTSSRTDTSASSPPRSPPPDHMPADLRRAKILERIQREGGASTRELARDYGVSSITVHRDLAQLAREGLIERIHGGARPSGSSPPTVRCRPIGPNGFGRRRHRRRPSRRLPPTL